MPLATPQPPESLPGGLTWEDLMRQALDAAEVAAGIYEVPVGAVLISPEGELLAKSCNAPISSADPTAHAEIRCLRQACKAVDNYRLPGAILAVTLEPCLMCAGALVHARVAGVVYGASDPKSGALHSRLRVHDLDFLNHRFWIKGGVSEEECSAILQRFFQQRR